MRRRITITASLALLFLASTGCVLFRGSIGPSVEIDGRQPAEAEPLGDGDIQITVKAGENTTHSGSWMHRGNAEDGSTTIKVK